MRAAAITDELRMCWPRLCTKRDLIRLDSNQALRLASILALALAGCATDLSTTAPPGPIVIHDKCIKQEKVPTLPPTAVTPGMTDNQKAAAMAVDARQGRQIAGDAIAALADCAIPPAKE